MSSSVHGRKLAALLLLAFACDGEFRFDEATHDRGGTAESGGTTPVPPDGAGATAGTASSAGIASSSGGASLGGSANGASGAAGQSDCGECAEYGLVCSEEARACVECLGDRDCPAANPYCDVGMHRCIPCTPSDGCEAGSVCDGWSHACLQSCATELDPDHDCSRSTHMCSTKRSVCVECLSDGDCSCNPHGQHCAGGARCAECAVDADCGSLGRFCDPLTFTCVVCRDFRDCGSPLVCDPASHTCVGGEIGNEK